MATFDAKTFDYRPFRRSALANRLKKIINFLKFSTISLKKVNLTGYPAERAVRIRISVPHWESSFVEAYITRH